MLIPRFEINFPPICHPITGFKTSLSNLCTCITNLFYLLFSRSIPQSNTITPITARTVSNLTTESADTPTAIVEDFPLPNGTILTKAAFLADPLFMHTPERDRIFRDLAKPLTPFERDLYAEMKSSRFSDFFLFQERPWSAPILATLAYFEGIINREELMVLHMIAETGFQFGEEKAKIRTISKEELRPYLTAAHFPPFTPNEVIYGIVNRKSDSELEKIIDDLVKDWGNRTIIERTVIEYTQHKSNPSITNSIYRNRSHVGIKDDTGSTLTSVLLPPIFNVKLAELTSSVNNTKAEDHLFMFGHNERLADPFYQGVRVISVASPLVSPAPAHGYHAGSLQLEMENHDVNYHVFLEYNTPNIEFFARLAAFFNPKRNPGLIPKECHMLRKISFAFAKDIVDREFLTFRAKDSSFASNFWKQLTIQINYVMLRHRSYAWSDSIFPDTELEKWQDSIFLRNLYNFLEQSDPSLLDCSKKIEPFHMNTDLRREIYNPEILRRKVLEAGLTPRSYSILN
jgi:hypothetical protein